MKKQSNKSQYIRLGIILIIGLVVFFNTWEDDEIGLSPLIAHAFFVIVTFIVGLPIIFIKNPAKLSTKFILFFISLLLAVMLPFFHIGSIKLNIQNYFKNKEITKVETTFQVDLNEQSIYSVFENHVIVNNSNGTLSVYDKTGNEVNKYLIRDIAKKAIGSLPLTSEQLKHTYYDGYEYKPVKISNTTFKVESVMYLTFRNESLIQPDNYVQSPDMPDDAKNIKYHQLYNFNIKLNDSGDIIFNTSNMIPEEGVRTSYTWSRGDAIVEKPASVLISNLK
ncbi:hypothetical protein [Peribacillus loiseleuriae]|uniref:Uncharacterized protein n=1 Tax=Peribacillus loiseleuriae TaxID=1679170 RepID=A0A0K9GQD1_9BACI|nr:hypothetical protein [Peribacillus loiseleuriae]KMY48801.1 hypothetical protein AC625_04130 [Peribacillus loiseleuriae]